MASIGNNPFEVELLTTQYTTALELLLQQKTSKLRSAVATGNHVGKMASPIQQVGILEYKQPGQRFSPLQFQLANFTRRWVFPNDRDLPTAVDQFDQLRSIVDPKGGLNMAVMAAAGRLFDDFIINAFFATASTGVDSSSLTTETFTGDGADTTTGFVIASAFGAASATGMTYPKIVEAYRILERNQALMDGEEVTLVLGSQQHADLKKQVEMINKEYNEQAIVKDGRVERIGGCNIIVSERLDYARNGANIRVCPVFVKSGMYLGLWKDMTVQISQRVDLTGHPWQLYSMVSAGATRTQLGKVIAVNCSDTTGTDPTAPA